MDIAISSGPGSQPERAQVVLPNLHRTHIALLAQSRSGSVRVAVAQRGDLPFGVQAALSNDDSHEVRATVAANPRTAVSLLRLLVADPHHAVLVALVANASAPRDVAAELTGHRRADVRNAALRRLEEMDAAASVPLLDPDALVPALSDRASATHGYVGGPTALAGADEIDFPWGAPLSRLAQHVGSRQRQIGRPVVAAVSIPSLSVSAAS